MECKRASLNEFASVNKKKDGRESLVGTEKLPLLLRTAF